MTTNTPEVIYLIDTGDGVVWCDDRDLMGYDECDEAVKYVRGDAYEALQAECEKPARQIADAGHEQGGTMNTKNTGGPAFPESGPRGMAVGGEGMSLRDAMALSVRMPDEFSAKWAAALVGSPQPGLDAEPIEHIDWWARAEAAYRYRIADAMLNAREEVSITPA